MADSGGDGRPDPSIRKSIPTFRSTEPFPEPLGPTSIAFLSAGVSLRRFLRRTTRTSERTMNKHSFRALLASILLASTGVAAAQAAGELTVSEVVVARSVEDHEPVEAGTSFSRTGGPLVCFIRASNRTGAESAVLVTWESSANPVSGARGGVRLTVPPSPRFRTYARTAAQREAGSYRCVVRSEDGDVLGSAEFTLTE